MVADSKHKYAVENKDCRSLQVRRNMKRYSSQQRAETPEGAAAAMRENLETTANRSRRGTQGRRRPCAHLDIYNTLFLRDLCATSGLHN